MNCIGIVQIFHDAKSFIPSRWLVGETHDEKVAGSLGKTPLFKGGKQIAK
jgi:hypothetical protein